VKGFEGGVLVCALYEVVDGKLSKRALPRQGLHELRQEMVEAVHQRSMTVGNRENHPGWTCPGALPAPGGALSLWCTCVRTWDLNKCSAPLSTASSWQTWEHRCHPAR
jgi:hypothetical protein